MEKGGQAAELKRLEARSPRTPPPQFLIGPPADATRHRHPETRRLRRSSVEGLGLFLIDTAVIRNRRKSLPFSQVGFSNRHKTPCYGPLPSAPKINRPHPYLGSNLASLAAPMIFLIGPPVIRISPNSFIFSINSRSNRREMCPAPFGLLPSYENPSAANEAGA